MQRAHRAVIFANMEKPFARETSEQIMECLSKLGWKSSLHSSLYLDSPLALKGTALAFSLGGDGTVLATARYVASFDIPIFPVNLGNFGFITEFGRSDWESGLLPYLAGKMETNDRMMLSISVEREGKCVFQQLALNDVVVTGAGISKLIQLHVTLRNADLGVYRADGMIVATPTGSTAYSAAAGGPILSPEVEAMIVNPICPFTLSHRPVVLPPHERVSIEVHPRQRSELLLTVDGQITFALAENDRILVERAAHPVRLVHSPQRSFYDVLRTKLNWSGGPDA